MTHHQIDRRSLLRAAPAALAAGALLSGENPLGGKPPVVTASPAASRPQSAPTLYRSVKWGMIGTKGTVLEKFQLMKKLGYDGIELVSPLGKLDLKELLAARDATEMPIHGLVDMVHWQKNHRLSSPNPEDRERGRLALAQAVRDAKALGGTSVLLVPGVVSTKDDANHKQVWERSKAEIRKVLPLCAKLGIHILIENVWNGFCKTPEQLALYLDDIGSPWVGAYFDIGNHVKFGKSEHWVRTLNQRIVKLDCKDWGKANGFCKIGDGDCNWPEVKKALGEIGYHGWITAEVGGGKEARLADIFARMKKVL